MKRHALKLIVPALALCLALVPLAACGGQQEQGGSSASGNAQQAAAVDTSSWKTLGDAIAFGGEPTSAGWDANYYVCVFDTDKATVRVVAKSNKDIDGKLAGLMPGSEDYPDALAKAIGSYELVSAEDITAEKPSQEQLDELVGKTGQELLDDGWKFASYFMYGGEQTGANMEKGNIAFGVTFDTKVSEKKADADTEGKEIVSAKVVSVEYTGASEAATNPKLVK